MERTQELSALQLASMGSTREKKKSRPELIKNIIVTIILSLGSVVMLLPFLWMVLATLKPGEEIYTTFFPKTWTAQSYVDMWNWCWNYMNIEGGFIRAFFNSVLSTIPVVVVQVIVSAFAAYAFAKIRFKGKDILFIALLATNMIPYAVVMLPQKWWYGYLLLDGFAAITIPKLFGAIGTVFFLRQFLYGIPDSISESARLDGAGYTRTFISIILPLVMPALATQAILSFIGNWNDFLGPLLYLSSYPDWQTLPLLVYNLNAGGGSYLEVPRALAASLISLVPIIVVFAAFQKKIVGSIVFSAVKG